MAQGVPAHHAFDDVACASGDPRLRGKALNDFRSDLTRPDAVSGAPDSGWWILAGDFNVLVKAAAGRDHFHHAGGDTARAVVNGAADADELRAVASGLPDHDRDDDH